MLFKVESSSIEYTKNKIPSAQIGAEFYHKCRQVDIDLHMEYRLDKSRFDCVMVKNGRIILIIEFKSKKIKNSKKVKTSGSQYTKYSQYGIDILYVNHMDCINDCVNTAKNVWNLF